MHAPVPAQPYGCKHYLRRCKLRASCCDKVRLGPPRVRTVLQPGCSISRREGLPQVFWCRLCHDEEYAQLKDAHVLDRRDVRFMVCSACDLEQEVAQHCEACGVRMGEYFCAECRLWDDDVTKAQFHCNGCGLCRKGSHAKVAFVALRVWARATLVLPLVRRWEYPSWKTTRRPGEPVVGSSADPHQTLAVQNPSPRIDSPSACTWETGGRDKIDHCDTCGCCFENCLPHTVNQCARLAPPSPPVRCKASWDRCFTNVIAV